MKIGLEIHKQISNKKLFCKCLSTYKKNNLIKEIYLPVSLNSNVYKKYIYKYSLKNCKYELDESKPILNINILKKAILVCKEFNFEILDEYIVMRKYILDGSLSSGFQRTGIIGINGNITVDDIRVKLDVINLEEDSCKRNKTKWIVNRQGVALIEITTEPIENPKQDFIKKLALEIGTKLENLKFKTKIGSIRQDINIDNGLGKVELKGVQDISLFDKIIENECKRQILILKVIDDLNEVNINYIEFSQKIYKIILTDKNIFSIFTRTINDITFLDEFDDYLKAYNIFTIDCNKLNEDTIQINLKPTSILKKDIIFNFFNKLVKKQFKCTRVVVNTYSRFLRDEQTNERMHLETELNKIKLNKFKFKLKKENLKPINLNKQNLKIIQTNKKIKNLFNFLIKTINIDDNLLNLSVKIYNGLNKTINLKKKLTKEILDLFLSNKITKLQIDFIIDALNINKKNINSILDSIEFQPITKVEFLELVSTMKYKTVQQGIGLILKKIGVKAYSYQYIRKLFDEVNTVKE